MKYIKTAFYLFLSVTISCVSLKNKKTAKTDVSELYVEAMRNSVYPEKSKIDTNLVCISRQNKDLVWKNFDGEEYILVVTWKQNISFYKPYLDSTFYNTGKYQIWVTAAPELLKRMKSEKFSDTDLRLKQLLGLPPNAEYKYFVEFWVRPQDLFRPCPDKETDDKKCDLCFPENAEIGHKEWINKNRIDRYYQCDLYRQYPWTQLGYTYDWNPQNATHFGLSEFVIDTNRKIKVNKIYTTEEYFGK